MFIRRFDGLIIDRVTEFYLWIYDWTGIYVGQIILGLTGINAAFAIISSNHAISAIVGQGIVATVWSMVACDKINDQKRGSLATFNRYAEWHKSSPVMLLLRWLQLYLIAISVIEWRYAVALTAYLCVLYVCCIRLRPRNRKTFRLFSAKLAPSPA